MSYGKPDKVSPGHVILLFDSLGKPAVLSPSCEASVPSDEKSPSIEDEADEFELNSLVVVRQVEEQHGNVEDPNEHPGAWLAPGEEDAIP